MLPEKLDRILKSALHGQGPSKEECAYRLGLPSESLEASVLMAVADAAGAGSRRASEPQRSDHGAAAGPGRRRAVHAGRREAMQRMAQKIRPRDRIGPSVLKRV